MSPVRSRSPAPPQTACLLRFSGKLSAQTFAQPLTIWAKFEQICPMATTEIESVDKDNGPGRWTVIGLFASILIVSAASFSAKYLTA